MVFNSRNKPVGSEAMLESETFSPDTDELCFTFFYQMSGKDLGTLKVIRKEGSRKNSTLWLLQGDQTNRWKKGVTVIQPSEEKYQIVFQGITANGTNGFMAIDDIRISKGEKCEITPSEAKPPEECDCGRNSKNCTLGRFGKVCDCLEGYLDRNGTCTKCDCGSHSKKCSFIPSGKYCKCETGYDDKNGICTECDCGSRSTECNFHESRKMCGCEAGYYDKNGTCTGNEYAQK
ncbi:MAM and LDL-receptor class A domain-containing protein 2 [Nephila pilipes]|uniref:MAM and LDL-receptor class A domain-containing protein 2 n=1 Tax=Nephila pilipes TaxID=299642 RepID=A0A8X6PQ89_NEPPI|nr:MAM and LDL-receptor class A domain-containing protein 2 [Nephila pilipes]